MLTYFLVKCGVKTVVSLIALLKKAAFIATAGLGEKFSTHAVEQSWFLENNFRNKSKACKTT